MCSRSRILYTHSLDLDPKAKSATQVELSTLGGERTPRLPHSPVDPNRSSRPSYRRHWLRNYVSIKNHQRQDTQHVQQLLRICCRIWLIETSRKLPSAQLHGFDISAAQYPDLKRTPPNVHLHVHDAFEPFSPEHHAKYDIVHVQFFLTLIGGHKKFLMALRNLISLLSENNLSPLCNVNGADLMLKSQEDICNGQSLIRSTYTSARPRGLKACSLEAC